MIRAPPDPVYPGFGKRTGLEQGDLVGWPRMRYLFRAKPPALLKKTLCHVMCVTPPS